MSIPDLDLVSVAIDLTGLLVALCCVLPIVRPQHAKPHTSSMLQLSLTDNHEFVSRTTIESPKPRPPKNCGRN